MKYLNSAQRLLKQIVEIVWILIDFSGSMYDDDYEPSRIEGAIQANTKLIETKAKLFPQDQMGIIAFEDKAYVLHQPVTIGKSSQSLCRSLRKDAEGDGSTNFTAALMLAEKCMFGGFGQNKSQGVFSRLFSELFFEPILPDSEDIKQIKVDDNITRRVIMLTDGGHNGPGSPVKTAKRLKDAGVIVECIGIAGKHRDVDEKTLKEIASIDENQKPRYCFIKDTTELIRKYKSMANHIRPV